MEDETRIEVSFKNNVTGNKKLQEYEERLKNIHGMLNSFNSGQAKSITIIDNKAKNLKKTANETSDATKKMKSSFDKAFNIAKISIFIQSLYKLSKTMFGLVSQSSSYIENVNLLEVAYAHNVKGIEDYNEAVKESSKSVKELIDKMSDVYGLDESRLTRSFGIFKQMANAMKLPTETAEKLSEHLVKMSNDIASLYNVDLDRAENALQSALTGQVRPIRSVTGADITEKTLQTTIDNLGLDRTIGQLSYVEKRLIMIISLTDQLKKSQGDYGRTINSVSNQIRVMHEQWNRVTRAVGNIFYPVLKRILPVLNAILMVITEIANRVAKFVAKLLGVDLKEQFDYSEMAGASDATSDLIEGMNDVSSSATGAGKAVDKLKDKISGLRGFDKLNVINTPNDSGSGSDSGIYGGGGVDPSIMGAFNDAFKDYLDMLDKANMKARKIRDEILKWLDLPLSEKIKSVYKWFMKLSLPMKIITGLGVALFFVNLYRILSKISKLTGVTTLFKGLAKIFTKIKNLNFAGAIGALAKSFSGLASALGISTGALMAIATAILFAVGTVIHAYNTNEEFKKKVDDMVTTVSSLLLSLYKVAVKVFDGIVYVIQPLIDILTGTLKSAIELLYEVVVFNFSLISDTITGVINIIVDLFNGDLDKAFKDAGKLVKNLKDDYEKHFSTIFDIFKNFVENIINSAKELAIRIKEKFEEIKIAIKEKIKNALDNIKKWFSELPSKLGRWAGETAGKVVNKFNDIKKWFDELPSKVTTALNTFFTETLPNWGKRIKTWATEDFPEYGKKIIEWFEKLPSKIGEAISKKKDEFVQKGKDIIKHVKEGITGAWDSFKNSFKIGFESVVSGITGKANGGVFVNGSWQPVGSYATGGLPPVGQMFVARENGPELVGTLNGHTAVMNNNQIVSSVSDGVYKAIRSANGGGQPINATFVIQVGSKEVAREIITDLQGMAKTNGKPITIGY